jgi:O-antigen ligase
MRLLRLCILLTFALIPVWYRLPETPPLLPALYVSRFLILLPMLLSIICWLVLHLPGFNHLRRDRLRAVWALALLLLALWVFASQLWAFQREPHPEVGATSALQFGVVALFALVVACAAPCQKTIIAVLVIGLSINALIGGLQVAVQGSAGLNALGEFVVGLNQRGVSVVQAGDVRWLRPYGLLPHPNMYAGTLVLGLLGVGAWMVSGRRVIWLAGTIIALLGLWVLGLTFSRAAWGGLVIGALVMLPFLWRAPVWRSRLLISLGAMIGAGVLFVALYHPFLLARVGANNESVEQRSISDRRVFTDFALRSIRETPMLGVGIGNFPWKASYYLMFYNYDLLGDSVHNIYLSVLAELGLIGLALYGTALLAGLSAAARALWTRPDIYGAALLGGAVALLAIGLLDHYPYTLLHFQTALWGFVAASGRGACGSNGGNKFSVFS